ncbi:MAG: hypothetical protein AB7N24_02735 [Dehalococcoidia bacterium]
MEVQLTERAQKRLESLVGPGAYPTAEAAVEAALEALEHPDFEGIDVKAEAEAVRADIAAGRVHEVTPASRAATRARVEEQIRKRQQSA